jgi:hypothetical protein
LAVAQWLVSSAGSNATTEKNTVCPFAGAVITGPACISAHDMVEIRGALACGVDVVQGGDSALLLACSNGRLDVARWLVSLGLDARLDHNNVRAVVVV